MIEIETLNSSTFYLNKDQTHPGRCILAFNAHKNELFQLSTDELHLFMDDVALAAKAIQDAFQPQKINYAIYGDIVSHLHFHIVPKYINGADWGDAFTNNPEIKKELLESQYNELIRKIKVQLNQEGVAK
ncbi:HIT family protein [Cytobacillus gottheilii]|uniref:HIT family protein n=1 Tax=Cytobacillus gottheilii TaxID=859144 RepID=UPI0021488281|nr:HIT family protein [Cytobacillus gottheilii]